MVSLVVLRRLFLITATLTFLTGMVCLWGVNHSIAKSLAFIIAAAALLGWFEFWKRDLSLIGTYATILSALFIAQLTFCMVAVIEDLPVVKNDSEYFWSCWVLVPLVALLILLLILTKHATIPGAEEYSELVDEKGAEAAGPSSLNADYGSQKVPIFRSHWNYQDRTVATNDAHEFLPKPKNPNDAQKLIHDHDQKQQPENDWWCC